MTRIFSWGSVLGATLWLVGLFFAAFAWAAGWGAIVWLMGGAVAALLGAVVLARSRVSRRTKFVWFVAAPVVLIIASTTAYQDSLVPQYPTTYILPDGYIGTVQVVFDENAPQIPQQKDGRRIIQIDTTGMAFVRAPFPFGALDERYAFANGDTIAVVSWPHRSPPTLWAVWNEESRVESCSNVFKRGRTPESQYAYIVHFTVSPLPVSEKLSRVVYHREWQQIDAVRAFVCPSSS